MRIWILIVAVQLIQELATAGAVFIQARDLHLNLWSVHAIFLAATLFDIAVGYSVGLWAKRKMYDTRLDRFIDRNSKALLHVIGRRGEKFALVVLGFVNYVYIDSFICAWLDIPKRTMFLYLAIGDVLQYALLWTVLYGFSRLTDSFYLIMIGMVVVVGSIFVLVQRREMR